MKLFKLSVISFVILLLAACYGSKDAKNVSASSNDNNAEVKENTPAFSTNGNGKVVYLNTQNFVDYVFDFRTEKEWNFKSKTPCVIDFYADWCKPCKMIAPIMEELAADYKGKIQFFKINIDMEQEVANAFNIQSIPSILLCPTTNKPVMTTGSMPKNEYDNLIKKVIFNEE